MTLSSSPAVGNFEQPVLAVVDPANFNSLHSAIAAMYAPGKINDFFKSVSRASLRIRDFSGVLAKGLLGARAGAEYAGLGTSDQGQIREFYLASLEKVAPELRQKFFRLYSYY